jgi:hypothetical protein
MDTSSLSPTDAAVALRSFPRRYGEAAATLTDGESPAREARGAIGDDSVLHLTADTTRSVALLLQAVRSVLVTTTPVLHAGVVQRASRDFDRRHHGEMVDLLAELNDLCLEFAELVERTASDDWTRTGDVAGGGSTTALSIVQEAVATAADNLREIERLIGR